MRHLTLLSILTIATATSALTGCTPDPTQHDTAPVTINGEMTGEDYNVHTDATLESYPNGDKSSYLIINIDRTAKINGNNHTPMLTIELSAEGTTTTCETFRSYIWSHKPGSTQSLTLECDTYIPNPQDANKITGTITK